MRAAAFALALIALAGCGSDGEVTSEELHRLDKRIAGVHVHADEEEVFSEDGRRLVLGTAEGRGERLRFAVAVDASEGQPRTLRAVGETHRHAGGCAGVVLYLGEGTDRYPYAFAVDEVVFGLAPDAYCEG